MIVTEGDDLRQIFARAAQRANFQCAIERGGDEATVWQAFEPDDTVGVLTWQQCMRDFATWARSADGEDMARLSCPPVWLDRTLHDDMVVGQYAGSAHIVRA